MTVSAMNFVMLLLVPISVVVSVGIQMVHGDVNSEGIMTFGILRFV